MAFCARARRTRSSDCSGDHYNIPLIHAQAQDLFLYALAGVTDPEQKRKTIGKLFIDVFDEHAKSIAADGRGAPTFLRAGDALSGCDRERPSTGGPLR